MRLMLLTADYGTQSWSGIGRAVERHALGLSGIGAEVHVFHAASGGRQIETTAAARLHLHDLNQPTFPLSPYGFDWIHMHSLSLAELALELRRRTRTPLVYTAHSLLACEFAGVENTDRLIEAQLQFMRICDVVVFLSHSERNAALALVPELDTRSVVVGNPVEKPPQPTPLRSAGPVVFAGRFARSKGIATLVELLPLLGATWPGSFVVAGGHGDRESCTKLRNLALQMGNSCSFPGWLGASALESLLTRASLVLVPSEYEPFGMIALEAMRVGTPVLAANVGGLKEIAAPESGAILVDSHDPGRWFDRVTQVLEDSSLSQELRQRGPRWVTQHFNEETIARGLVRHVYVN